jgi:hypothetical protein
MELKKLELLKIRAFRLHRERERERERFGRRLGNVEEEHGVRTGYGQGRKKEYSQRRVPR